MSSSATPGGARQYFCHQCDRTVSIPYPLSSTDELSCPFCHGGFIEEFDLSSNPNPNPNPNPSPSPSPSPFPDPFASLDLRDLPAIFGLAMNPPSGTATAVAGAAEPFNAVSFLQNYIAPLLSGGGGNIQLVIETGSGSPFPIGGGNLGDYFIGPGLEQLIQQLAENDPNRHGTPPASKDAVRSLPDVKITSGVISSDDGAQCAVCKDEFEIGAQAKQMPCKHLYHTDCIMPWLEMHNSCPVCRFELPTDDPDYESRRRGQQGPAPSTERTGPASSGGGGGGGGGIGLAQLVGGDSSPGGASTMERRFRIHLPWPFRGMGGQAEAGDAGAGGSGEGRDENSGDNRGSGGPRQEDLD